MGDQDQPQGLHSAVAGREREFGLLSAAVRRLIELSVTTTVAGEELASVAASIEELARRLAVGLPDVPFARFVPRDPKAPADSSVIEQAMPFDVVVGRYNPLALPIRLDLDPPVARGTGIFTTPYEGAPGCVHGASIAGAFDIVLTAANMIAGAAGPTVRLALTFRRPTLVGIESVFEAQVDELTRRRVHTSGRLVQNGMVTVEAEGEFASLDMEQIKDLHRR